MNTMKIRNILGKKKRTSKKIRMKIKKSKIKKEINMKIK